MRGGAWAVALLTALAAALVVAAVPAAAETYYATAYPYSVDVTLTSTLYDRHEGTASKGQVVSFSVEPGGGGCIQVYFVPMHNVSVGFLYLTRQSRPACGGSFSGTYSTGDAGIDFTIVIDSTSKPVDYHLEIDAENTSPWDLVIGAAWFCGLPVLIAAIIVAVYSRRKRAKQAVPGPTPGPSFVPPSGPPGQAGPPPGAGPPPPPP